MVAPNAKPCARFSASSLAFRFPRLPSIHCRAMAASCTRLDSLETTLTQSSDMGSRASLSKQTFKFFRPYYSPEYKKFITSHLVKDSAHPLHTTQVRRARQRKQEGLWLEITADQGICKSSFVRTWARRRLRVALVQELKANGYDESGKAIERKGEEKSTRPLTVHRGDITGSLRLHVLVATIPAKFVDIQAEAKNVVEFLVKKANPPLRPTISSVKFSPMDFRVKYSSERKTT